MNKRVIGVLVSLALAAIGTWVIVNYVQGADDRALEDQETVEILVVDQPIAKGTPAEDIGGLVKPFRMPVVSTARGAITDLTQIEGRFASVDLLPGEQLVSARFVEAEALVEVIEIVIPENLLEVTVDLSPERVIGGELEPGDVVSIIASFQPFTLDAVEPEGTDSLQEFIQDTSPDGEDQDLEPLRTPNTTHIISQNVLVTNIQFGSPPAEVQQTTSEGIALTARQTNISPTGRLLVTVALDAADVEKLVFTAEFGSIWLAKETPLSGEGATEIQTRGTIYL